MIEFNDSLPLGFAMTTDQPLPMSHPDVGILYQALGQGLARWQHIETALFLIAFMLMETDKETCSLAFFQIKSAETKTEFVDRLIYHKLDQRVRSRVWAPIRSKLRDIIEFRNSLAHFEVVFITEDGLKEIKPPTKYRAMLSSHHLDYHAGRSGTTKGLSVELIESNSREMVVASLKLIYFILDHCPNIDKMTENLDERLGTWLKRFQGAPRDPSIDIVSLNHRRKK